MSLNQRFDRSSIPQFYFDKYPEFVEVIDYYYRWVDQNKVRIEVNRNIDSVENEFVDDLVNEITTNFPLQTAVNKTLVGRFAREVFRARGTKRGIEQLFRLMLGVNAKVEYPGDRVFTPSADIFSEIQVIEVTNDSNIDHLVDQIVETTSGGSFAIRSVKKESIGGRRHTLVEIDSITLPVNIGDSVFVDSSAHDNANIVGSIVNILVRTNFLPSYQGEQVTIVGTAGGIAQGIVAQTTNYSSQMVTNITAPGTSFTSTPEVTVSDTILRDPSANIVAGDLGATVSQRQFYVTVSDGTFSVPAGANVNLLTVNGSNVVTANTTTPVVAIAPSTSSQGTLIVSPAANVASATFVTYGANTVAAVVTAHNAAGKVVGTRSSEIGISNTTNSFVAGIAVTGTTNAVTPISVSTIQTTKVGVAALGATIPIAIAGPFDPVFGSANTTDIVFGGTHYRSATVGIIDQIDVVCSSNTISPIISIKQPMVSTVANTEYTITVGDASKFVGGETIIHTSNANTMSISVSHSSNFNVGDLVCSPSTANATFLGIVRARNPSSIIVKITGGTVSMSDPVINVRTNVADSVAGLSNTATPQFITGTGRITSINGNTLTVHAGGGTFAVGGVITGQISGYFQAIVTSVGSGSGRGLNFAAQITNYNNQTLASKIRLTDCGGGYTFNQVCAVYDNLGNEICDAIALVGPIGKVSQPQSIIKSGVSQLSHLHDNDYYQQYSYEIKSPLSFDMYSQQIKRFIHVSGTRMFGSIQLTEQADINVSYSTTVRTYDTTSGPLNFATFDTPTSTIN